MARGCRGPELTTPPRPPGSGCCHAHAATGRRCQDLLSGGARCPFNGSRPRPEEAEFSSVLYWNLEGQPAWMDADGDGIPCETLHDPTVISAVLHEIAP